MIIYTKFHKDWSKIVDFFLLAIFGACLLFFPHPLHQKNLLSMGEITMIWVQFICVIDIFC